MNMTNHIKGIETFTPKYGEEYWFVAFWQKAKYGISVVHFVWDGSSRDYFCLKLNNCFKTKEEAENNKEIIFKKLTKNGNNNFKNNQKYWYVTFINDDVPVLYGNATYWNRDSFDYQNLYIGNCFHTREEAEANKFRIYKELTGKEWGEE